MIIEEEYHQRRRNQLPHHSKHHPEYFVNIDCSSGEPGYCRQLPECSALHNGLLSFKILCA